MNFVKSSKEEFKKYGRAPGYTRITTIQEFIDSGYKYAMIDTTKEIANIKSIYNALQKATKYCNAPHIKVHLRSNGTVIFLVNELLPDEK